MRVGASTGVVRLAPIDDDNVKAVCRLTVAPGQEDFVADNVWSLAEAYANYAYAWPRAIVRDDRVAGFLMLEIDLDEEQGRHYWLWRLMVGADHQRQGVGAAAIELACDEVRSRGGTTLYTSWVPGEAGPEPFYLGLGFAPTGEVDEDGEIVACRSLGIAPPPGGLT